MEVQEFLTKKGMFRRRVFFMHVLTRSKIIELLHTWQDVLISRNIYTFYGLYKKSCGYIRNKNSDLKNNFLDLQYLMANSLRVIGRNRLKRRKVRFRNSRTHV